MKRAVFGAATLAAAVLASPASAAEHQIMILPDAYFPAITYINPGDTVRFINASNTAQTVVAADGSWTLGPIEIGTDETLVIDTGLERTFHNKALRNSDGSYAVSGDISFEGNPVD